MSFEKYIGNAPSWQEALKKIAAPGVVPNQFMLQDFVRSFALNLLDEVWLEQAVVHDSLQVGFLDGYRTAGFDLKAKKADIKIRYGL
jgi:hypothetical protein